VRVDDLGQIAGLIAEAIVGDRPAGEPFHHGQDVDHRAARLGEGLVEYGDEASGVRRHDRTIQPAPTLATGHHPMLGVDGHLFVID